MTATSWQLVGLWKGEDMSFLRSRQKSKSMTDSNSVFQLPTADETQELIALRAYELYLSRGAAHGSDIRDWLTAEAEVLAAVQKMSMQTSPAQVRPATAISTLKKARARSTSRRDRKSVV